MEEYAKSGKILTIWKNALKIQKNKKESHFILVGKFGKILKFQKNTLKNLERKKLNSGKLGKIHESQKNTPETQKNINKT